MAVRDRPAGLKGRAASEAEAEAAEAEAAEADAEEAEAEREESSGLTDFPSPFG